jgi:hypothetical protein
MENENKELQEVEAKLVPVKQATIAVVAKATNIVIKDPESNQKASGILGEIVKWKKQATAERLSFTRPLDAVKKMIMEKYAPAIAQFEKAEDIIKGKMRDYFIMEQEKQRIAKQKEAEKEEAIRKAAEELLAHGKEAEAEKVIAEIPQEVTMPQPEKTVRSIQGHTTSMKTRRTFRITDIAKVPREFFVISEKLIQEAVDNGAVFTPENDGIEIYEDIMPSIRIAKQKGGK